LFPYSDFKLMHFSRLFCYTLSMNLETSNYIPYIWKKNCENGYAICELVFYIEKKSSKCKQHSTPPPPLPPLPPTSCQCQSFWSYLILTKRVQLGNYMPDIYILFTILHLFVGPASFLSLLPYFPAELRAPSHTFFGIKVLKKIKDRLWVVTRLQTS
jgi:hypothetical protein